MPNPLIFVGSSAEALPEAKVVKSVLAKLFTTNLWSERLFELGEDNLSNLLRFVQFYDFAVLVLSDDDTTISRKKMHGAPRDNVIFELGLFMGALGRRRVFPIVIQTKPRPPKIPSDLLGNNVVFLRKEPGKKLHAKRLSQELSQVVDTITARSQEAVLQLLPSTGLAVGYFENFVLPVCQKLANLSTVTVAGADVDISKDNFNLTIVLPKSLSDASIEGAKKFIKKRRLKHFTLPTEGRSFPFYISSTLKGNRLLFFDYPTTLRASHDAVQMALAGPFIGYGKHHAVLDSKEINNFHRTLLILLARPPAAEFRDNVKFKRLT
jgi:hypothetical protein